MCVSLKHRYLKCYIPYYVLDKKVLLFIKGLSFPLTYKLNKNMYKYIYLLCAPFFFFFKKDKVLLCSQIGLELTTWTRPASNSEIPWLCLPSVRTGYS